MLDDLPRPHPSYEVDMLYDLALTKQVVVLLFDLLTPLYKALNFREALTSSPCAFYTGDFCREF
jgi:hypothetical protein